MASTELQIELRVAWWWPTYLQGVIFFALTFNLEPDWEKVQMMIGRAIRFRFAGGRKWHRLAE